MSDTFFNCIIIAAIFMLLVPHACAENVTYPQEYYDLNKQADDLWYNGNQAIYLHTYDPVKAIYSKLSANQIALEKQNELISEQNELLKKLIDIETSEKCSIYTTTSDSNISNWQMPSGVYNIDYDIMPISTQ